MVDDSEDIVDIFTELLSMTHAVRSTYSSTEALEMLVSEKPDVLITDYNMPDLDGGELAKIALESYAIPTIIMTGNVNVYSNNKDIKVMYKPVNYKEFLKNVTEMGMRR